jgi:leucyl-tRNA synthetase
VKYKLRDWIFSRQRYWGEPFPIILDAEDNPWAVPETELPVTLPEMADFKPTGTLEPPLSKARDWMNVNLDGKPAVRETNTMPQWAGSCWYYLRFIDPKNPERFVDPAKEKYWMPVDLYVGGAEHAVLHLLYSRFWHKVLFDLGHVSTPEPFAKLVNQGTILGEMEFHAFRGPGGAYISAADLENIVEESTSAGPQLVGTDRQSGRKSVAALIDADQVEKRGERYVLKSDPSIAVEARSFKMSKSRGNIVNPDEIVGDYGADTFRLYEMYMGPLEQQKPWNTRDIVGMSRFLNGVYRNLIGDEEAGKMARIVADEIPEGLDRQMHRTIKKVGEDIVSLRFNTAIAELIKLNNEMTKLPAIPKQLAETFTLLLAPLAPHLAEEIWSRLGHDRSLARHAWPKHDEKKLVESKLELPIQINGKLRGTIWINTDETEDSIFASVKELAGVRIWIDGKTVVKQIYVPGKLVSFVVK